MRLVLSRLEIPLLRLPLKEILNLNSSPLATPKRPTPPPPGQTASMEKVHLWLIVLGTLLILNMMACVVLFLRSAPPETPAAPTVTATDKEEMFGKIKVLETELGKYKTELTRQKQILSQMQSISESLQLAVMRIPPPNEPPHGPPPAPPVEVKAPAPEIK